MNQVYATLQSPTKFTITGSFTKLPIRDHLENIKILTLLLDVKYLSINSDRIENVAVRFPKVTTYIWPRDSPFSILVDIEDYFGAIESFLNKVQRNLLMI